MHTFTVTLYYRLMAPAEFAASQAEHRAAFAAIASDPAMREADRDRQLDTLTAARPEEVERETYDVQATDEDEAIAAAIALAGDHPDDAHADRWDD